MRGSQCRFKGEISNLTLLSFLSFFMVLSGSGAMAEEAPSLVVFPFVVEKVEDRARGAVCPVCKGIYGGGEVAAGSQNILTRELYHKMEALGTFRVVPLEKVEELRSGSAQMRI